MPKDKLGDEIWIQRLRKFAIGEFKFGQGQYPPPGSKWRVAIDAIKKCTLFGAARRTDLFGNRLGCSCHYHQVNNSNFQLFSINIISVI